MDFSSYNWTDHSSDFGKVGTRKCVVIINNNMKIFSTLALLSLALLSCSSALDEANNSQQEALDEAHQANLTGKEAVAMREVILSRALLFLSFPSL